MTNCLHRPLRYVLSLLWPTVLGACALAAMPAVAASGATANVDSAMGPRVLACTTCHGKEGRATQEGFFPRLAGKPAGYLFNQLVNFREGRRSYPQMGYLIEHLTDDYLREIATHFAGLQVPYAPPPAPQAGPQVLERGRQLVQQGEREYLIALSRDNRERLELAATLTGRPANADSAQSALERVAANNALAAWRPMRAISYGLLNSHPSRLLPSINSIA